MKRKLQFWGLIVASVVTASALAQQAIDIRRERSGASSAAKDALEGKAPPALDASAWLNTKDLKPLAWKDLAGKVVLIDFWAHW